MKEYLARAGPGGSLLAHQLREHQRQDADERERLREERQAVQDRADALLRETSAANDTLRAVVEGALTALGFRRHHRGGWRMQRANPAASSDSAAVNPIIHFMPPDSDHATQELFAAARAGNDTAIDKVKALMATGRWTEAIGNLGRLATEQLIRSAAGNDPVWAAAVTAHVNSLRRQLLGDNPSVLEVLLVRRVLNEWVAVHRLELELALRPVQNVRLRESLEKSLGRAQKRMTSAVRELARVRRLQTPKVLAKLQVNLNADQIAPPPRLGTATVAEEK